MAKLTAGFSYTDQELLDLYRECAAKIAFGGQTYKIGTRVFTRANLPEVKAMISELEAKVSGATRGLVRSYSRHGRR